jgi:hypothetical protein
MPLTARDCGAPCWLVVGRRADEGVSILGERQTQAGAEDLRQELLAGGLEGYATIAVEPISWELGGGHGRPWAAWEERLLRRIWDRLPRSEVARQLQRSRGAVYTKALDLGLFIPKRRKSG